MACDGTFDAPHIEGEYAKNVTGTTGFLSQIAETQPAPERAPAKLLIVEQRLLKSSRSAR